jgi:microcystin degradation protein MlrC
MRVVIGGIQQETNTFSLIHCDMDFFRQSGMVYFAEGPSTLRGLAGTRTEIGGMLAAAGEEGVEIVPTFAAHSMSGGKVAEDALEWMLQRILDGIRAAGPIDGALLAMHGGMVSEGHDDATGYVMEEVRKAIGPDVPMGVGLDLHANPYPRWTELADVIISYHTYPHAEADLYQTGYDVARLLFKQIRGTARPVLRLAKAPMLAKAESQSTMHDGPLADMQRQVRELRAADRRILAVSLLPVQPWLDVAGSGFSVLAIADGEPALAQQVAERFADEAWERRHEFDMKFLKPAEAVQRALEIEGGPIVLSDPADGVGGGSAGDGTHVLKALLGAMLSGPALVTCIDPEAVQTCIAAGFNKTVTLEVGGKRDPIYNSPVRVTGRVKTISDAGYRAYGMTVPMGPSVVLEIGQISLLLITNTVHVINPWVFRAMGLEPTQAKIVLVKSPAQFREEFEPIAKGIIMVDAPGICSPNYQSLPFTKITRPLYPWDDHR